MDILRHPHWVKMENINYNKDIIEMRYTARSGETLFHVSREGIYPSGYAFAVAKGAPYLNCVNKW